MKLVSWGWLLILGICLTEARYRMRRPGTPVQLFKKQWPMVSRISMGNNFYVGGNFPHKRMSYKPSPNYRIRRPPTMFNVLQTTWKNHVPAIGTLNNRVVLPQRPPVKDFHGMNKVSEYSPEYRPETSQLAPTHRRDVDDDKGPIHTIPAPNLSLADKPYTPESSIPSTNPEKPIAIPHQHQTNDVPYYNSNLQINSLGNIGSLTTSSVPQRPIITSPTPTVHQYEVTETNEIGQTIQPTYLIPEIDVTRVADLINSDLQGNEVFLNHPTGPNEGLLGTNVQFAQPNGPMQTNLHGSLHVRFPGTGVAQSPYELDPRIPNFQDLLQQPQIAELLQPEVLASFPQPQMHSFNYDEQANKPQQKQQHIFMGQNYASGRVTADYNIEPESTDERSNIDSSSNEGLDFIADGKEPSGNNIEFDESNNQRGQTTYFNQVSNNAGGISTQFYTTLPSREAAEKLAALAAAGNVNSQLITQLRKQQGDELEQNDQPQNEQPIPINHKDEDYQMSERDEAEEKYYERQQQQYDQQQQQQQQYDQQRQQMEEYEQQIYDRQQEQQDYKQEYDQQQKQYHSHQVEENDGKYDDHFVQDSQSSASKRRNQNKQSEDQRVKIVVPNTAQYEEDKSQETSERKDNVGDVEYDYDADDKDSSSETKTINNQSSQMEFGTRLRTKPTERNE